MSNTSYSEQFSVTFIKGALGAEGTSVVDLLERLPDERMFSRVYVNKYGIITGGVYAEDAGLPDDPQFGGHEGMRIPAGTSDQRPAQARATIRYNTDDDAFEFNEGGVWVRPFRFSNLSSIENNLLPRQQGPYLYQIDIGSADKPFQSGTFGRLNLKAKASLTDADRLAGTLVNFNGTLYWGGAALGTGGGGSGGFDPANIASNVVPASNNAYELGSATNAWAIAHIGTSVQFSQVATPILAPNALWFDNTSNLRLGSSYVLTSGNASANLPIASGSVLGVVRIGNGLSIDGSGLLTGSGYTLPISSSTVLGGVKIGNGIDRATDGTISVSLPAPYTLPQATAVALGGVKVGAGLAIDGGTGELSADYTLLKLDTIADVAVTAVTNGQSIRYNSTNHTWEPYTPAAGPSITVSTAAPTGTPADGALWFQVPA